MKRPLWVKQCMKSVTEGLTLMEYKTLETRCLDFLSPEEKGAYIEVPSDEEALALLTLFAVESLR